MAAILVYRILIWLNIMRCDFFRMLNIATLQRLANAMDMMLEIQFKSKSASIDKKRSATAFKKRSVSGMITGEYRGWRKFLC